MTIEQKELLRIEVLNFLARRHLAAFNAKQIAVRLRTDRALDFEVTDAEVNDACGLLLKLGQVQELAELEFEVIPHYQATGKGVIQSEKWRAARGMI